MNRQSLCITIALSAFALPAVAQLHVVAQANPPSALKETPAAPALPEILKVVTRADAERFAAAEFAFADADANKSLSRAEFVAFDKVRKAAGPGGAVKAPLPVAAASSTASPASTTAAPAFKSAEAQFTELAGKETALAQKAFIDARLAAFAAADADKSGALAAAENNTFAALVAGKTAI